MCWAGISRKAAEEEADDTASEAPATNPPISRFERVGADHGKPTIAAINGAAYGGGLEKALTCDIRICSDNARMALAEVKVGLCPPGGSFNLPRLVGLSNAMWLLLSGETGGCPRSAAHGAGDQGDIVVRPHAGGD